MPRLALLDPTRTGRQADDLENRLGPLIVGQDEAIHQIVRAYQTHVAGLSPVGRPVGNFFFLGPTGSGKTRTVEATAESLLQNSRAVIKIDCAEFQHSHEIAKLIGSTPGYPGRCRKQNGVPGQCHRCRQGVLAGGGHRFQVWRAALEARDRAPTCTTVVEPDGQRTHSPRRLYLREPQRGRRGSDIWP
jgi:hypothetical protein